MTRWQAWNVWKSELSQRAVERQTLGARSGARETPPEKYQDAVAEYFKKLSQPKTN